VSVLAQAEAAPYRVDDRARRLRRWPVAATVLVGYAAVQFVLAGFAPTGWGVSPTSGQRFVLDGLANISALAYWALLTCSFSYLLVRAQRRPRVPPVIIAALSMVGMLVVQGSVIRELAAGGPRRGFLRWWPTTITNGWAQYGVHTHPHGPPAHTTLATSLLIIGPVVDYGVLMVLTWRAARLTASRWRPQSSRQADAVGVSAALGLTAYVVWLSIEIATSVKFALVTVAALLLWRLHRNWLWPLALVFSCVVAWHLVGLIVN
jgi:hypothetical protein